MKLAKGFPLCLSAFVANFSGLGVNNIKRQRGIFPDTGFGQNVLAADGQPIQIRFDVAQLAVFRWPGVICLGIGRLENTNGILFFPGDNVVFFKYVRLKVFAFKDLFQILMCKFHQNRF